MNKIYALKCNKDKLIELLPPGYMFRTINTVEEDEDGSENSKCTYITNSNDIVLVHKYFCFGCSILVVLNDGTKISIYEATDGHKASGKNSVEENVWISPRLTVSADDVEITQDFESWLIHRGVDSKELEKIVEKERLYRTIEYAGIPNVVKKGKDYWYSSDNLVLYENEIESVLNGIKDELLSKKIEEILTARIYKQRY